MLLTCRPDEVCAFLGNAVPVPLEHLDDDGLSSMHESIPTPQMHGIAYVRFAEASRAIGCSVGRGAAFTLAIPAASTARNTELVESILETGVVNQKRVVSCKQKSDRRIL